MLYLTVTGPRLGTEPNPALGHNHSNTYPVLVLLAKLIKYTCTYSYTELKTFLCVQYNF